MEEEHVSDKTYYVIFAVLMVLLVVTVGVARIEFGIFNVVVALTVAVVKAVLIILYFMHVRYSTRLIQFFAVAAFFWLVILLGFTFTDYLTRPVVPVLGR